MSVVSRILGRVHINRNARAAKAIFCISRKIFAGVLYVRQENLTKKCRKLTTERALSVNVNTP